MRDPRHFAWVTLLLIGAGLWTCASPASSSEVDKSQVPPTPPATAAEKPGTEAETEAAGDEALLLVQDRIAARFRRFEKTLLDMAEYMRKADPERADLLIRAIGKSKEDRINQQMLRIVELLEKDQLGDAVERQGGLVAQLQSLLTLLQSEDRRSEIEKEKARIQDLIKALNRLIGKEKDVRAATERGENPDGIAGKQENVKKETGDLVKKIDGQDAERNRDKKPAEGKPSEGKPSEGKPSEGLKPVLSGPLPIVNTDVVLDVVRNGLASPLGNEPDLEGAERNAAMRSVGMRVEA